MQIDDEYLNVELTRLKVVSYRRAVIEHHEKLMLGLPSVLPEVPDIPST